MANPPKVSDLPTSPLPTTPRPSPLSMMPSFAQPVPETTDPAPAAGGSGAPPTPPATEAPRRPLRDLLSRRPADDGTSTATFSRTTDRPRDEKTGGAGDGPTKAETAEVIAGILGLLVLGVALVIEQRGRKLRKPTHAEYGAIATPIASIVLRHADAEWLHPDLVDVLVAGNAIGAYVNSGEPLITRSRVVDDGVPANLQQEEEQR